MKSDIIEMSEWKRRRDNVTGDKGTLDVQADLVQRAEELLADVKAGRVDGFMLFVELKNDNGERGDLDPYGVVAGNMTRSSALWLAELIRHKVGPRR